MTSIGDDAFYNCDNLTSVTIGDGVTSIGDYAFRSCTGLTEINWNALSVADFDYNSNVFYNAGTAGDGIAVTFGDSVEKIPAYLFYVSSSSYSPNIKSVIIGSDVTSIGDRAFYNCTGITSVTIGDGVTSIGDDAFRSCTGLTSVTIPDSVTSIGDSAFSGCTGLTSVTIGSGVTSIGDYAFYNCSGLTSVTIPDSVTSIGDYAFYNCSGLTSVTIGAGVKSIGSSAFEYCYKLVEVYNKSSLSITAGSTSNGYIGYYAKNVYTAEGGSWLTDTSDGYRFLYDGTKGYLMGYYGEAIDITLPDSFSAYDGTNVNTYEIYQYAFYGDTAVITVTIPDSVTSIGDRAFYYCTGLTEINWNAVSVADFDSGSDVFYKAGTADDGIAVTFGESVEKIPAYLFYISNASDRPNIKSVTIGSNVTSIGDDAFYGCTDLTSVAIGDGVTSIGSSAFYECTGLTSVTIGAGVTSIGESAFEDCTGLTSVTIGAGVTSIGSSAFRYCYKLVEVYNKSSLSITAGSSSNGYIGYYAKNVYTAEGGSWLTDTSDGYRFLYDGTNGYLIGYCGDQTELTLPDSFTAYDGTKITEYGIYRYAFYKCSGLTSVTIPDSVTSIGNSAFYNCTGLTSVCYTGDIAGWCGISGLSNILSSGRALYIDGSKVEGAIAVPDGVTSRRDFNSVLCVCISDRYHGHNHPGQRDEHRELCVQFVHGLDVRNHSGQRDEHRGLCVRRLYGLDVYQHPGRRDEHRE